METVIPWPGGTVPPPIPEATITRTNPTAHEAVNGPRAKVFISCGQAIDDERRIAAEIAVGIRELGFEPYVATQEQTLEGLKSNIFHQLETSEYFLFIDFKREQFANSTDSRGSLFTNQELGIASFLGLEVIAFQEQGVKPLDGMKGVLQLNAHEFNNRNGLVDSVLQEVKNQWKPSWKNKLVLQIPLRPYNVARDQFGNVNRFFHLDVANLHNRRSARQCQVYPTMLVQKGSDQDLLQRTTELKWAGYAHPEATIRAGQSRPFDALVVLHTVPSTALLSSHTDASDFLTRLAGPAEFMIEYEVVSLDFPPSRCRCHIVLGNKPDDASITILEQD